MDHCIQHFSDLKIHNNKGFCYKSESKFYLHLCVEWVVVVVVVVVVVEGVHKFWVSHKGRVMVFLTADWGRVWKNYTW